MSFLAALPAIGSAILGYIGGKETNEANKEQTQMQMDFQERMSNTAYQRAVTDMKTAGLNPMLAYQQGGASTPQGAAAKLDNAIGQGIAGAKQGAETAAATQALALNKAQVELIQAQAAKTRSETLEQDLHSARLTSEIGNLQTTTKLGEQSHDINTYKRLSAIEQALMDKYGALSSARKYEAEMGEPGARGSGFAADVARRKAEAQLQELKIPKEKAEYDFWDKMGPAPIYLQHGLGFLDKVTSAGRAHRTLRK